MIAEKDIAIGNILRELEDKKTVESQYHTLLETNRAINDELLGLRNKVTHLDTALKQVAEMKTMLLIKDKEIEELEKVKQEVVPVVPLKKKKKEVVETEPAVNDF